MALIPKVEAKQEKKVVSARLDEDTHLNFSGTLNSLATPRTNTSSANP